MADAWEHGAVEDRARKRLGIERLVVSDESAERIEHVGAQVLGVVSRDGGYTAKVADACVIVPTVNPETITPHAEAFQAVVWHLFVSHPKLKVAQTKWESTK